MTEIWKPITYRDIAKNTYEVSNEGNFRKMKSKKPMYGCNPKNEKGYMRISLKSESGKIKKYSMHRIVLYEFTDFDDDGEVNHINGNKLDISILNLEPSTRKENAHHASVHNLYKNCENHYRSRFTNEQVDEICKLISEGYAVSEVIRKLHLENGYGDIYSNIDKIINGKSWKKISSKYKFDKKKYHYKTYSYDDILKMCDCIFNKHMKNREIVELFPQYNEKNLTAALKSIKARRIYKDISKDFIVQRLSNA